MSSDILLSPSHGDFDLNDKDRPGRPIEADDSLLEKFLEQDPRQSTRDLAIQLNLITRF